MAEVLTNSSKVFDAVVAGDDPATLDRLMSEGEYHGMQTFDQALLALVRGGEIEPRDALAAAQSPQQLTIAIQQFDALSGNGRIGALSATIVTWL